MVTKHHFSRKFGLQKGWKWFQSYFTGQNHLGTNIDIVVLATNCLCPPNTPLWPTVLESNRVSLYLLPAGYSAGKTSCNLYFYFYDVY